jgi:MFS family permease
MTPLRRLQGGIPAGPARILGIIALSGSTGTGLFLTGSVLYYTRVLGLSDGQVGLGLSLAGLCGLVAAVPLARLTDRIGTAQALMALNVWRMIGYGLIAFARTFEEFLVTICLVTIAERVSQAANQAMVGEIFSPEERPRTMSYVVAVSNTGLSLGAMAAALALSASNPAVYRILILANAASFVPMALLTVALRRYIEAARATSSEPGRRPGGSLPKAPGERPPRPPERPVRSVPLLLLSAANGLLMLHDSVLFVALPLWISQRTDAPRAMVGIAIAVNTVLTAFTQVRWSRVIDTFDKAVRALAVVGLVLATAAGLIAAAHFGDPVVAALLIVTGAVVLTCGENLHSACWWQVAFSLSPSTARAQYMAVFGLGQAGQEVIGPSAVTGLALRAGPVGWLALAGVFIFDALAASGLARLMALRRGTHRRARAGTVPEC